MINETNGNRERFSLVLFLIRMPQHHGIRGLNHLVPHLVPQPHQQRGRKQRAARPQHAARPRRAAVLRARHLRVPPQPAAQRSAAHQLRQPQQITPLHAVPLLPRVLVQHSGL